MTQKKDAQEVLDRMYKRQNKYIAENYDRVSLTLPKGTKQRITSKGETVNGFINRIVLAELDRIETGVAPGPVISAAPGSTVHKEKPTAAEQPATDQQEEPLQDLRIRELGERIKQNIKKQDQEN